MIEISSKNYGFIAYLIYKYNGSYNRAEKKVSVRTDKSEIDLVTEFNQSEFSVYNEVLKKVVKS